MHRTTRIIKLVNKAFNECFAKFPRNLTRFNLEHERKKKLCQTKKRISCI